MGAVPGNDPVVRTTTVATPIPLTVHAWGRPGDPPVVLVHGGGDFARSFDGFAPLLAHGGHHVVSWDQRGHGDSARAELYVWAADVRDTIRFLEALGDGPHHLVGHSKGGVLAIEVAAARPDLVASLTLIDGFARRWSVEDDVVATMTRWLDARRRGRSPRPGTRDELADRRAATSPRVDAGWQRHLVDVGAVRDDDGTYRWKIDGAAFPYAPHPSPIEHSRTLLGALTCPVLALVAGVAEPIAGQPTVDDLRRLLPPGARLVELDGLGHFAHVEDPDRVADLTLGFLADLPPSPPLGGDLSSG
ncbi:MAG: alpha/beta hydrolase [Actinobacteria bacterium]|nr:alpha/beta hydrolase [Actinomycetota bacterium]